MGFNKFCHEGARYEEYGGYDNNLGGTLHIFY